MSQKKNNQQNLTLKYIHLKCNMYLEKININEKITRIPHLNSNN